MSDTPREGIGKPLARDTTRFKKLSPDQRPVLPKNLSGTLLPPNIKLSESGGGIWDETIGLGSLPQTSQVEQGRSVDEIIAEARAKADLK